MGTDPFPVGAGGDSGLEPQSPRIAQILADARPYLLHRVQLRLARASPGADRFGVDRMAGQSDQFGVRIERAGNAADSVRPPAAHPLAAVFSLNSSRQACALVLSVSRMSPSKSKINAFIISLIRVPLHVPRNKRAHSDGVGC